MAHHDEHASTATKRDGTRVGVLDFGIGGFGVVSALRHQGWDGALLYIADNAGTPYGLRTEHELEATVQHWCLRAHAAGCGAVVVACNAASTVLHRPSLRRGLPVPVIGVIDPTARHLARAGMETVALIGGRRTVESGAYPRAIRAHGGHTRVHGQVAQPLSALVEAGMLNGDEVERAVAQVLAPIHDARVLVSACTHYAALRPVIKAQLPDLQRWIEPATWTAKAVIAQWGMTRLGTARGDDRALELWTTGAISGLRARVATAFNIALAGAPVQVKVFSP